MALIQRRLLDVLLHDVLVLRLRNLAGLQLISLLLRRGVAIVLSGLDALLDLQVLVHILAIALISLVQLLPHVLHFLSNENTAALRPRLWLADEEGHGLLLGLLLGDFAQL